LNDIQPQSAELEGVKQEVEKRGEQNIFLPYLAIEPLTLSLAHTTPL
jgi:hypothetical protein